MLCHASAHDSTTAFRTAEPSMWPGAVIIGVRALALAPYLEPRGVYFILVLSTGEEAENESEGASIAPRARPRMRIAALPSHRIDPAGCAAVRPPQTRAVASPPLPLPPLHRPAQPQRRTRPARPLVGLTSSSAAPSAATVEVAAAGAADKLVGPKRRRATTLTRLLPTSQASTQHERGRGRRRRRVARRRRRCHCRRSPAATAVTATAAATFAAIADAAERRGV